MENLLTIQQEFERFEEKAKPAMRGFGPINFQIDLRMLVHIHKLNFGTGRIKAYGG